MAESCADTALTITTNLLSLLTFLLGLLASYLTFYTLALNALFEISSFKQDLASTRTQLHTVLECCASEACLAPVQTNDPEGMLGIAVKELEGLLRSLDAELDHLMEQHSKSESKNGKGKWWWWLARKGVWIRLRWVSKRKQISTRMVRVSALKMEVHVAQMALLLKKIAAQDQAIYSQRESC